MGRKRKHNKHLPRRVYLINGIYYLIPKDQKPIRLGKTLSEAMSKWADIVESPADIKTCDDLIDWYLGTYAPQKSPRTFSDNQKESKWLRLAFGSALPRDVSPNDIKLYLKNRRGKTRANREIALFSDMYTKGIEDLVIPIMPNPCKLCSYRNKEARRDRYVEDYEFAAVWNHAPPVVQIIMDILYITGLRPSDVLKITIAQASADELIVQASKTAKRHRYPITGELQAIINRALYIRSGRQSTATSTTLLCTRTGEPYKLNGIRSMFKRSMDKALADELIDEPFRLSDLRPKYASDLEEQGEDATKSLGHSSRSVTSRHYLRRGNKSNTLKIIR